MPRMSAVGSLPRIGGGCPSTVNFVMRRRVSGRPSEKLALLTPWSAETFSKAWRQNAAICVSSSME